MTGRTSRPTSQPDQSPSQQHDGLGEQQRPESASEALPGRDIVPSAQLAPHHAPFDQAHHHATGPDSAAVDMKHDVSGDFAIRRGSTAQSRKKKKRVPVAAGGGSGGRSENAMANDSRVKGRSFSASPLAPVAPSDMMTSGASHDTNARLTPSPRPSRLNTSPDHDKAATASCSVSARTGSGIDAGHGTRGTSVTRTGYRTAINGGAGSPLRALPNPAESFSASSRCSGKFTLACAATIRKAESRPPLIWPVA